MNPQSIKKDVLRTLLYYDIFNYPLKDNEVFKLLPCNSIARLEFLEQAKKFSDEKNNSFAYKDGYFYIKPNEHYIQQRLNKESYSKKQWMAARVITHIIKRFPFVRAVLVTGSLSKNNSDKKSDLDFMVITKKNRLWIPRTLLMLFKKIFLLNSYKYFCINYFISEESLEIEEKNIFTAAEIAHIKATFNSGLMEKFIRSNEWIKDFFPNYITGDPYLHSSGFKVNNNQSYIGKLFEIFFIGKFGDGLNNYFRKVTVNHWKKKYSYLDDAERDHMFKSTQTVSKTHPGNMQKKILNAYSEKLRQYNLNNG
ncbi:MAG: nucleotidyltransferase domain-containing protein [Ignavibacteria bacterium]